MSAASSLHRNLQGVMVPRRSDGSQYRHQPTAVIFAVLRISFALTIVNAVFWSTQWSTQMMSHRYLSFLVQGSDHVGDSYLSLQKHFHAPPKLPLTSQHLPHAWAMGGVYVLCCWGVTRMGIRNCRNAHSYKPQCSVYLNIL